MTVLYRTKDKGKKTTWVCKCDCGNLIAVISTNLISGATKSCGCYNDQLKRSRFKDITNKRFGKLIAVEKTEKRTNSNNIIWKCKCDCGNECEVSAADLIQGHTKSCGCLQKEKIIDLTNQKFGRLSPLYYLRKNNRIYWHCKCDCGNEVDVQGDSLRRGATRSCGCWQKEVAKISGHNNMIDITGQKFNKLTALYPIKEQNTNVIYWHCKCDCGSEVDVNGYSLRTGDIKSCGCLISVGEEYISNLLKNNNIIFKKQKTFETCKNPKTGYNLRFDFYVDNKYLIEFDGSQHFYANPSFNKGWNTEENYLKTKELDEYKNQWCKENNIPLIRISYTHLNDLCIEDLLLETTKFLIN